MNELRVFPQTKLNLFFSQITKQNKMPKELVFIFFSFNRNNISLKLEVNSNRVNLFKNFWCSVFLIWPNNVNPGARPWLWPFSEFRTNNINHIFLNLPKASVSKNISVSVCGKLHICQSAFPCSLLSFYHAHFLSSSLRSRSFTLSTDFSLIHFDIKICAFSPERKRVQELPRERGNTLCARAEKPYPSPLSE